MAHNPKAIANYFLELARADDEELSPLKIQKLVYYANGWHLAIKGKPLISEQVEAWPYGPVVPSLYRAFRSYGDGPITEPARETETEFSDNDPWEMRVTTWVPKIEGDGEDAVFARAL